MKQGVNEVTLTGNAGRDPEVKYLQNGETITTFSMATPVPVKWTETKRT